MSLPTSTAPEQSWLNASSHSALVPITLSSKTYSLHVSISGPPPTNPTQPLVLLEAGLGASLAYWVVIAREIAKFSRVLSYSRSGLGQSTAPPEDAKLTTEYRIQEVKQMLQVTGLEGPYVLVGHSYGGPLIREFARQSDTTGLNTGADNATAEIAGMVFVDSFAIFEKRPPQESWAAINQAAGDGWMEKVLGLDIHHKFTKEEWEAVIGDDKRAEDSGIADREGAEADGSLEKLNEAQGLMKTDRGNGSMEYTFFKPPKSLANARISVVYAPGVNDWDRMLDHAEMNGLGTENAWREMREWIESMRIWGDASKLAVLTLTAAETRSVKMEDWAKTHNLQMIAPEAVVKEVRWVLGWEE